jgi:DNA-binding transcriptional ArsR family regulator
MPDEKLARAIRSKIRRKMLFLLCQKEKIPVHEIANILNITESSASKHLKLLYDLGLLGFSDFANEKFYFLKIKEIKNFLEVYNEIAKKIK